MKGKRKDPQDEAWRKITKEWGLKLDQSSFDYGWAMGVNWMIKKYGRTCK